MLRSRKYIQFILLFTLTSQLLSIVLSELVYLHAGDRKVFDIYEQSDSIYWMITESVIIAPVLESAFMFLLIEICWKILSKSSYRNTLSIILVGAIFGALHFYNSYYIFATAIIGCWYTFSYLILKARHTIKMAFWGLVLIHAMDNLITIFLNYL